MIFDRMFPVRCHKGNRSCKIRRHHAFVYDRSCLLHFGIDITSMKNISFIDNQFGIPELLCIKRIYTDTSCDKCTCIFSNSLKRAFNSIKNII